MRVDVLGGLLIIVIGAFGLMAASDLERGTGFRMGPGYLPLALAWAVVGLGALIAALGWRKAPEPMPEMAFRPLAIICGALLLFGLAIDRLGILIAVAALVAMASLASPITRHRETPVLMAVLAIGSALVFVKGLGLAIPLYPR